MLVVSPTALAVKNEPPPTTLAALVKFSVAPVLRVKVPPRFIVPTPKPPRPAFTRRVLVPPVRLRLPRVMLSVIAPRLMYSNAPPSSWMATVLAIRLFSSWIPLSSQRRRELRMLMVSPVPMPEKVP